MLVKNPLQRTSKFSQIRNSPYFSNYNFEDLLAFNMTPPHIPKLDQAPITDSKAVTFAHYMKNSLTEYKPPSNFTMDKKQQLEYANWYKNF